MLAAQTAGLCATAFLVWSRTIVPRLPYQTIAGMTAQALIGAFAACALSAVLTVAIWFFLSRSLRGSAAQALRTARTAVWFAPAAILLASLSPAAIGVALILVVSVTRLLYSEWRDLAAAAPPPVTDHASPGTMLLPRTSLADVAPALLAAAGLEGSAVAFLGRYPLAAAASIALGVAMLTLALLITGIAESRREESLPRSVFGLLLTVILAATLTVGGLAGRGSGRDAGGAGSDADQGFLDAVRGVLHERRTPLARTAAPRPVVTRLYPHGPVMPGIILQVDTPPQTTRLPAPRRLVIAPLRIVASPQPTAIPFSGLYSIFRASYDEPPEGSPVERGTPLKQGFETTDFTPMRMEAYQNLTHPIDLSCCGAIDMMLSNADRFEGGLEIEPILRDTEHNPPPLSLGRRGLTLAHRPWGDLQPVSQTLRFPVPAGGPLRQFNQIAVLFHLAAYRADHSARISIDRFVLVPP